MKEGLLGGTLSVSSRSELEEARLHVARWVGSKSPNGERLLTKHAAVAAHRCPTLNNKPISPHVLRHTSAMRLLHAGVDTTVIALWLGHETTRTTDIYLHADLALKERALARTTPPHTRAGRYRPPDSLLAFLESL
jgi:integrase/recombinase XerD